MKKQADQANAKYAFRQGVLLSFGSVAAQLLGFFRNVLFARLALPIDFGVASLFAVVALMLQMIADFAIDKFIVQNKDGDSEKTQKTIHILMVLRGLAFGLILYFSAPFIAQIVNAEYAVDSFRWLSILPIMSGLIHSDIYRFQREFRHVPYMLSIEMLPQLISFILVYPFYLLFENYNAMLASLIACYVARLCFTHLYAERVYRWGFSRQTVISVLTFAWPIMLTAFPLYAIFQGDKIIVANLMGVEALAIYSAAFMLSMIAANTCIRIISIIFLPVLAKSRDDRVRFMDQYILCNQLSTILATFFSFGFIALGGTIMVLAFGSNYAGHSELVTLCGIMWGVRMLSIAPTVALLANGNSRATLMPSILRASALIPAYFVLSYTQDLEHIVILGAIGEIIALLKVFLSSEKSNKVRNQMIFSWIAYGFLIVISILVFFHFYNNDNLVFLLALTGIGSIIIGSTYLLLFPSLIRNVLRFINNRSMLPN